MFRACVVAGVLVLQLSAANASAFAQPAGESPPAEGSLAPAVDSSPPSAAGAPADPPPPELPPQPAGVPPPPPPDPPDLPPMAAGPEAAAPRARDVSLTSGLALGVSFPTGGGLVGIRADYLFQLPNTLFRLGVHAAVGALLCPEPDCHASYTFGVLGSLGHQHRLFLEAKTGTLGGVTLSLHGQDVASRAVWGVGAIVGYEYMSDSGFFLRFGFGFSVLVEPAIELLSDRIGPALTLLHLGWKLW